LRGERRSKGARAVFAARRKRNKADFATTRVWGVSPTSILASIFAARRRKNIECVHTRIACQKTQVWLHLPCLPLVHPSEKARKRRQCLLFCSQHITIPFDRMVVPNSFFVESLETIWLQWYNARYADNLYWT